MLSTDVILYLGCLLLTIPFGPLVYSRLAPGPFPSRHLASILLSMMIAVVCFGLKSSVLLLFLPLVSYVLMAIKRASSHVILFTLSALLIEHWFRNWYEWKLDHTGVQMMMTMRMIGFAMDYSDGNLGLKLPSIQEYLGYVFFYPLFMAGPPGSYVDYMKIINTKIITPHWPTRGLIFAFITAWFYGITSYILNTYPYTNSSILTTMMYIHVISIWGRCRYYTAWNIVDAAFAGIGVDYEPCPMIEVETAATARDILKWWNQGTAQWLRRYIYDKNPSSHPGLMTMAFSAVWHGFYPGFLHMFLMLLAVREVSTAIYKRGWMDRTWVRIFVAICTHLSFAYFSITFILLDMNEIHKLYSNVYYCWHVIILGSLIIFAFIMPKSKHIPIQKRID